MSEPKFVMTTENICKHKRHFKFKAKRLVYKGLGSQDYVYFTVFSHHKSFKKALQDELCTKINGVYEVIGTLEQNDLKLIP